jgi:hypothetical protein
MRSVHGDKGTENIADNDNVTSVTSRIHVCYRHSGNKPDRETKQNEAETQVS